MKMKMNKTYKDTDLREALRRKYADTPKLPADFMTKMRQRMEPPAPPVHRRWRWVAAAACLIIIIGIGVTIAPFSQQTRDENLTAKQAKPESDAFPTTFRPARTAFPSSPDAPSAQPGNAVQTVRKNTLLASKAGKAPLKVLTQAMVEPDSAEEIPCPEPHLIQAAMPSVQSEPEMLTERDIPITRPENYKYTPEEIALMKKQAYEAYLKWVELELEIAKYNQEQTANNYIDL